MSEFAETMAAVVSEIHPLLKAVGFRKRRHTFNRSSEPGVTQVINFQMAQRLPPGAEPIPPVRLDLYGMFTVNFGIAIREAWDLSRRGGQRFPDFVNDYDCEIRERLGQIIGKQGDTWWPLSEDAHALAREVGTAIFDHGIEWLDRRGTRSSILELYDAGGLRALPLPTALPIVMILRHRGAMEQAAVMLRAYYEPVTHPGHRERVFEIAELLGITGLSPP